MTNAHICNSLVTGIIAEIACARSPLVEGVIFSQTTTYAWISAFYGLAFGTNLIVTRTSSHAVLYGPALLTPYSPFDSADMAN